MSDSLPLIWTEGGALPAAPAVYHTKGQASVKIAFLLFHVRTETISVAGVHACSREAVRSLSEKTFYRPIPLWIIWKLIPVSSAEVSPLQLSTRLSLARLSTEAIS